MTILEYISNINQRYKLGNATEHTFRGDLQQLIESLVSGIQATNEPKRQACGAPDYILTKRDIPIGFIEAKDIGDKDLEGKKKSGNKEQFDRYKVSLDNLIFTDYIDFHLYNDGQVVSKIAIAEITDKGIIALPHNFNQFENLIIDFCAHIGQNIKSPKKLAEMMAGKARLLSDVIEKALTSDEDNHEDSTLKEQMIAFKSILIHDITPKGFADVYAQTIAYGMFAARLHDPTLDTFSRQEAAELIPKSNPFLRKLFGYIAGPDIDDRIKWIVDNLTEIFLACNVDEILKNYGKATQMEDPIIHFYETFLAEYDPKLRKARGVWYTPAPIVNFIVRSVDEILKTEFNLPQGLADNSKTTIKLQSQTANKNFKSGYKEIDQEIHKVQILDPATGTGTFLAEVIKQVKNKFKGQEGIWSSYVEDHLLPRLNGFELLMASYAMAHLQLDLLLKETGFVPTKNKRTKVYLTNSLEEHHPNTGTLFANWLSSEANEANHIKRDTPVMCIIGNPPYSVSSSNKSDWIENLMIDYKKDLNERNINPLSDDYLKFIRFGQHYIKKNGEGILAYISNNSFIDGKIHRRVRKSILEEFDKIYILDLHGSAKRKEKTPEGKIDQNVFDIMQGVSITFLIKTTKQKSNGKLFHSDLYGKRNIKYDTLSGSTFNQIKWKELVPQKPDFYFVPKDYQLELSYKKHLRLSDLFILNKAGLATEFDDFVIRETSAQAEQQSFDLQNLEIGEIKTKYHVKDKNLHKVSRAITDLVKNRSSIVNVDYRPFDKKFSLYTGKSNGIMGRPRDVIMKHMIHDNISLVFERQCIIGEFTNIFISTNLIDAHLLGTAYAKGYSAPLYTYPLGSELLSKEKRKSNLNPELIKLIEDSVGLVFNEEKDKSTTHFSPIDIVDYIYAVLHSPQYRKKYKEFLKTDFPRVPYPTDITVFWQLVEFGKRIRELHLLESPLVEDYITTYPINGSNIVTNKIQKKDWELIEGEKNMGRIWINQEQYFDKIPLTAWEFYIGSYQPAQKWLKDRQDKTLEFNEILHYQKIIRALFETDKIMKNIEKLKIE